MSASSVQRRSRLMQLLGLGFAHPVEELHQLLIRGEYQACVGQLALELFAAPVRLPASDMTFAELESGYIRLFGPDRSERAAVGLHAGDHAELLANGSRGELMLEHIRWYRHFGVTVRADPAERELPDHLVCQLEFLAWLAHLEATAVRDAASGIGYRLAQRDFLVRHVLALLQRICEQLREADADDGVARFYGDLAATALIALQHLRVRLDASLQESNGHAPAMTAAKEHAT